VRSRIKSSLFTSAETFVPIIKDLLLNKEMSKKDITKEIKKWVNLNKLDLEIQSGGVPRFYKTLDWARKRMIKEGTLEIHNNLWRLRSNHG